MNNFDKIKHYIENKGGRMLSTSVYWKNGNFEWLCNNNHKNSSKIQMLKRQSWCKECRQENTKNKVVNNLSEISYTLLNYSSSKCTYICDVGHKYSASASHIIDGNKCGICFNKKLTRGFHRLTKVEIENRLQKYGFTFLDDNYKSLTTLHKIKCKNNHVTKKQLKHLISGTAGCPECNNYFKSERSFRQLIEQISKKSFPKTRPSWLINPKTNYKLELDCYNEELKLAFEYDGQFHFEVRKGLNNNLEKTKELDLLKNRLCKENGVKLIRIPYYMEKNEIIRMLIREVDSGVACPDAIKLARAEARAKIVK